MFIDDVFVEGQYEATAPKDRLLKSAKPVHDEFIPSDQSYLKNDTFVSLTNLLALTANTSNRFASNCFLTNYIL
jgi:hypothetical protein